MARHSCRQAFGGCIAAGLIALLLYSCAGPCRTAAGKAAASLISKADSLFACGNYEKAKATCEEIRKITPAVAERHKAHFLIAYIDVFYKNPKADWNAALREFDSFAALYPDDPRIGEALSWIRMLKTIKSIETEFKRSANRMQHLIRNEDEVRESQRLYLDSIGTILRSVYESRDSVVKKNSDLENMIIDLEKKCQQAGK